MQIHTLNSTSNAIEWICRICQKVNLESRLKCSDCGVTNTLNSDSNTLKDSTTSNACNQCTFINKLESLECEMCGQSLQKGQKGQKVDSIVKFSFRGGGMNEFLKHLQNAIAEKEWNSSKSKTSSPFVSHSNLIGVSGIIQTLDTQIKQQEKSLNDAFTDLNSLMSKASDMVKLANAIGSKLVDSKDSNSLPQEIKDFKNNLMTLGIENPISRESLGNSDYFIELSREICQFLDSFFTRNTISLQMISTIDLYCLFNRVCTCILCKMSKKYEI